jgi:ABC-type multidrug transport system ATPase subunit
MGNPSLVLLDEPSDGLAPVIVEQMAKTILDLKREGLTVLLSEQNLHFARAVADRALIIEKGRIRFSGTMAALMAEDAVRAQYLSVSSGLPLKANSRGRGGRTTRAQPWIFRSPQAGEGSRLPAAHDQLAERAKSRLRGEVLAPRADDALRLGRAAHDADGGALVSRSGLSPAAA